MTTQTIYEPITKTMTVARGIKETFSFYTDRFDEWWPKQTHSIGTAKVVSVTFEPREGGRIFETHQDGTESVWGIVTVWDAPNRFVHSWQMGRAMEEGTEVEVIFTALNKNETRVDLIHRNWENLGDAAALLHGQYDSGWDHVFGECFGGLVKGA